MALAASVVLAPTLEAQETTAGPPRAWSLDFVYGTYAGGPTDDIEAAMRSNGFADSSTTCFFGCSTTTYPQTDDSLIFRKTYWGAARRRLGSGPWHFGLGGGTVDVPSVEGYRQKVNDRYDGVFVTVKTDVVTLAPMVWFEASRALRLGAGPAFHRIDLSVGRYGSEKAESRTWKAGFVVEAALTVPVDTPVYFIALAQYRFSERASTPAWTTTTPLGSQVEFPATSVGLSHAVLALGVGGRF